MQRIIFKGIVSECLLLALVVCCARSQTIDIQILDSVVAEIGDEFYGIQHHAHTYDDPVALEKLSRLPLSGVRTWAYPSDFHAEPGVWDWEALDKKIAAIVGAGYEPMVCLFQAENWYKGSPDDPWWNDEEARAEWTAAARALGERYGDVVDWWIVFDEVNYLHADRDYYMSFARSAELYLAAAEALVSVDADARVGGPSGFGGWENGHWANYVLGLEGGAAHLDFVSSNLFLSWDKDDTNAHIMDRTIWYEEAPLKIREMIGPKDDPLLVLDAYNASALWTIDGTPGGELWTDPRNVNTFGGVYQAAALLHSARGGFDVALRWETLGGFGILSWYPDFRELPPYYAWLLVSDQGRLRPGSQLLSMSTSEEPKRNLPHHSGMRVDGFAVQPFAVRDEGGMSIILVNKYGDDQRAVVSKPEGAAGYEVYRFDADRHEASTRPLFAGRDEAINVDLPGLSVAVIRFDDMGSTGAERPNRRASGLTALANRPNPFHSNTTISFELHSASAVALEVYSALGRRVASRSLGRLSGGRHAVEFGGSGLSSGVYFYRVCADGECATLPMMVSR